VSIIPSNAERIERIESLVAVAASAPDAERVRLDFAGDKNTLMPVIKLPLDYVLLNPGNHRIAPFLESHPKRAQIEADPYSADSQEALADLIRRSGGFDNLKANLRADGQEDQGIVTRAGLLVNANRRAVALRDLNPHGYIEVMVLPPKSLDIEIARLESDLQNQESFKEPYTFTAELLFVEDWKVRFHMKDEEIARALKFAKSNDPADLRKGARQVQSMTRMLGLIRELQARSDGAIPTYWFDESESAQSIIELDLDYQALVAKDPKAAAQVKEAWFLVILTGVPYRKARGFADTAKTAEHLPVALAEAETFGPALAEMTTPSAAPAKPDLPGVASLADDDDAAFEPTGVDLAPLVDLLAKTHGKDTVTVTTGDNPGDVDRVALKNEVAESLQSAIEAIRAETTEADTRRSPLTFLREARTQAEASLAVYKTNATKPGLPRDKIKEELVKLRQIIEAIQAEVDQGES
jgi:hypothetical protein